MSIVTDSAESILYLQAPTLPTARPLLGSLRGDEHAIRSLEGLDKITEVWICGVAHTPKAPPLASAERMGLTCALAIPDLARLGCQQHAHEPLQLHEVIRSR